LLEHYAAWLLECLLNRVKGSGPVSNLPGLSVKGPEQEAGGSGVELRPSKKNSRQRQIEHFRRSLLQARQLILEELSPAGSSLIDTPVEMGADIFDRSTSDLERTLSLILKERGRNKLKAIEDALERIQEGTFGFCEECGEKIPLGRLEVMPFATTCRDCKTQQERREKLLAREGETGFSDE
jgi:DnaK suppressor protein